MPKLPHPPAALPAPSADEVRSLPPGTLLFRVYRAGGPHPTRWDEFRHYGPVPNGRFDHHDPPPSPKPDRGVMYLAQQVRTAVVETFGDSRTIDRARDEPWLVGLRLARAVRLLDLSGAWPTRAGASQAISSGRRDVAQHWSRDIYSAFGDIDGLLYPSAIAGGDLNVALYERALDALPDLPELNAPLAHPGLLDDLNRIAIRYGFDLA